MDLIYITLNDTSNEGKQKPVRIFVKHIAAVSTFSKGSLVTVVGGTQFMVAEDIKEIFQLLEEPVGIFLDKRDCENYSDDEDDDSGEYDPVEDDEDDEP